LHTTAIASTGISIGTKLKIRAELIISMYGLNKKKKDEVVKFYESLFYHLSLADLTELIFH
jgi:hypothetical protein